MVFSEEAERWVGENYPNFEFLGAERKLEKGGYVIHLTLKLPSEATERLRIISRGKSRVMATSFETLDSHRVVFKNISLVEMGPLLSTLYN